MVKKSSRPYIYEHTGGYSFVDFYLLRLNLLPLIVSFYDISLL